MTSLAQPEISLTCEECPSHPIIFEVIRLPFVSENVNEKLPSLRQPEGELPEERLVVLHVLEHLYRDYSVELAAELLILIESHISCRMMQSTAAECLKYITNLLEQSNSSLLSSLQYL